MFLFYFFNQIKNNLKINVYFQIILIDNFFVIKNMLKKFKNFIPKISNFEIFLIISYKIL